VQVGYGDQASPGQDHQGTRPALLDGQALVDKGSSEPFLFSSGQVNVSGDHVLLIPQHLCAVKLIHVLSECLGEEATKDVHGCPQMDLLA